MKNTPIQVGDIVVSNQGRDKGTYYIIIALLADNYCILVNGDNKKFAREVDNFVGRPYI